MCLFVLLAGLVTVTFELRMLGVLTRALGPYGSSWVLGLILVTFWVGTRLLRRARDPRYVARWAEWAQSGNPKARPQDAFVPAAQTLGALLLMVPGPLTDLLGLALQSPLVARFVAGRLLGRVMGRVLGGVQGGVGGWGQVGSGGGEAGEGGYHGGAGGGEEEEGAGAQGAGRRRRKGGGAGGGQGGGRGQVIDVKGGVRRDGDA